LGAQMAAYLENGHWLELAAAANGQAQELAQGLARIPGVRLPWPCEANEVFAILPRSIDAALKAAGGGYLPLDISPKCRGMRGSSRRRSLCPAGHFLCDMPGRCRPLSRGSHGCRSHVTRSARDPGQGKSTATCATAKKSKQRLPSAE